MYCLKNVVYTVHSHEANLSAFKTDETRSVSCLNDFKDITELIKMTKRKESAQNNSLVFTLFLAMIFLRVNRHVHSKQVTREKMLQIYAYTTK